MEKGLQKESDRNSENQHDSDSNQTTLIDMNREKEVRNLQTEINIKAEKAEIGENSDDEIRVVGCVSKSKVINLKFLKILQKTSVLLFYSSYANKVFKTSTSNFFDNV